MTAAFVLALVSAIPQDVPKTVFRAESRVVYVDVLVEREDRAVAGLTAEDFDVLDDGVRQELTLVDREGAPRRVLLALDTSTSMRGAKLRNLRAATRAALDALKPGDAAGLITFSHHARLRQSLTTDREPILRELESLDAYGATAWHDALFAALVTVGGGGGRPIVVLFTDGDDTYSWIPEDGMRSLTDESNALVYAVTVSEARLRQTLDVRTPRAREALRLARVDHSRRTRLLRELTEATGGRLVETGSTDDLQDAFVEILRESETRYLLAFAPESPVRPGWHELEVKLKSATRGVTIHARRGYYYEPR